MKKLFLSFIILAGTVAVATAQTSSAGAKGSKWHPQAAKNNMAARVAQKNKMLADAQNAPLPVERSRAQARAAKAAKVPTTN